MKDKTKLDFYEVLPKNREDADVNLPKPASPGPASGQGGAFSPQGRGDTGTGQGG